MKTKPCPFWRAARGCPDPGCCCVVLFCVAVCNLGREGERKIVMNQLRRRFASLWKREEGGDDAGARQQQSDAGNNGQNPSRRTSNSSNTSSAGVPAALEIDAAGTASTRLDSQTQQRGQHRADGEREEEEDAEEDEPSPPRLLALSHPWGTSDPRPPPGWTTNHRLRRRGEETAADGHLSSLVDLSVPAGAAGSASQESPRLEAAARGDRVRRRRRGREEEEDDEEGGGEVCSYRNGTSYRGKAAVAKRHRASEEEQAQEARHLANGGVGGGERGDGEEDLNQQQQQQQPDRQRRQQQHASRRRRTCPADSAFVSPAAKQPVSYCASTIGATAVALAADQDHEELEHRRSSTPSRLIFRAGFFKALRGSRAAAKRARSATKLKRKTRELQAAIVRQAFHSAHPQPEGGGGGGSEEQKEEGMPRRGSGGIRGVLVF